tara:strand:+ start:1038 stop:1211 length:174 start_codon:yes stop_codon:yes gene_type:complete
MDDEGREGRSDDAGAISSNAYDPGRYGRGRDRGRDRDRGLGAGSGWLAVAVEAHTPS